MNELLMDFYSNDEVDILMENIREVAAEIERIAKSSTILLLGRSPLLYKSFLNNKNIIHIPMTRFRKLNGRDIDYNQYDEFKLYIETFDLNDQEFFVVDFTITGETLISFSAYLAKYLDERDKNIKIFNIFIFCEFMNLMNQVQYLNKNSQFFISIDEMDLLKDIYKKRYVKQLYPQYNYVLGEQ